MKSSVGGVERAVERTTPEAIELQRTSGRCSSRATVACAIEVSSHALELHRADAIRFAAAIFTNLTQDHLDFHPTMEDYYLAKRRLFDRARRRAPRSSTSTTHTARGSRASEMRTGHVRARPPRPTTAPSDVRDGSRRLPLHASTRRTATLELRSPLRGRFNVYNVLGAFAAARALGVPLRDRGRPRSRTAGQVPGRFEPVDAGQPFAVLVDYAHTPGLARERAARRPRARRGGACTWCSAAAATAIAASAR